MALEIPLYLQAVTGDPAITYSAAQNRALLDLMTARDGVSYRNDLLVAQRAAGANFSMDVAAGVVAVSGTSVAYQGAYVCRSTSSVNVPMPAPPGTGSRTDLVVAQVFDKQADGGSQYGWAPLGVQGTVVPANAIALAQVTRTAGEASILAAAIKDVRLLNGLGDVPLWELRGGNGQVVPAATDSIYNGFGFSDLIGVDNNAVNGQIVIRTPGRYMCTYTHRLANGGSATATRGLYIGQYRGGTQIRRIGAQEQEPSLAGGNGLVQTAAGTARCQAGDVFAAISYQFSGATLNLSDAFNELGFTGVYVGP